MENTKKKVDYLGIAVGAVSDLITVDELNTILYIVQGRLRDHPASNPASQPIPVVSSFSQKKRDKNRKLNESYSQISHLMDLAIKSDKQLMWKKFVIPEYFMKYNKIRKQNNAEIVLQHNLILEKRKNFVSSKPADFILDPIPSQKELKQAIKTNFPELFNALYNSSHKRQRLADS